MAIQVTCPGCMKRFSVAEKYAGKTGPCPNCKKQITIPKLEDQVVIHEPESAAPKDSKGVSVLKPIRRKDFVVPLWLWMAWGVGAIVVLIVAAAVRDPGGPPAWILALGAVAVAPPIVAAGYTIFRDDELEGYSGREFWTRAAICSLAFAATWLVYVGLARYFDNRTLAEVPSGQMALFIAGMVVLGLIASLLTFELEVGQAALHYLAYFVVTFVLCLIVGLPLAQPLGGGAARRDNLPDLPTRRLPSAAGLPSQQTTPAAAPQ